MNDSQTVRVSRDVSMIHQSAGRRRRTVGGRLRVTARSLLAVFAFLMMSASGLGTTIFVDDNAVNDPGAGDPTLSDPLEDGSAAHPFDSIQEGINAATSGVDEVVVLAGTYTGLGNVNVDFLGKAIVVRSDAGAEQTIVDMQGVPGTRGFVFQDSEFITQELDGFTITGGSRLSPDPALGRGGGVYCDQSSPLIRNCVFSSNAATEGGGLGCVASHPTLIRCRFENNTSTGHGGGLFNSDGYPKMFNTIFSGNVAGGSGGGMYNFSCSFGDGPGPEIVNGLFTNNTAAEDGGAIASIEFCLTTVFHATLVGNMAASGGGVFHDVLSQIVIGDSVIWGNAPDSIDGSGDVHDAIVIFTNIQGGLVGEGNVDIDPQFVDAAGGNYRLRDDSPLVDAANPLVLGTDKGDLDNDGIISEPLPLDLDDTPRVTGDGPDMGAYETSGAGSVVPTLTGWGMLVLGLALLAIATAILRSPCARHETGRWRARKSGRGAASEFGPNKRRLRDRLGEREERKRSASQPRNKDLHCLFTFASHFTKGNPRQPDNLTVFRE